ncbi:hypothetical protein CTA2_8469 [Colletotrichum tanaceti]|uniref:Uncharacterized protein n=1 Tax=Colletotrichum tanaceti TaxID=1306861 RepID=A0A4U6X117_9PEZI|nr:hypothetical protein CTA2_8469 [Colletotrichum tanaceti]TKW48835.1 hypothetical protein CTA1_2785 [Colletotrichum tanaceti]
MGHCRAPLGHLLRQLHRIPVVLPAGSGPEGLHRLGHQLERHVELQHVRSHQGQRGRRVLFPPLFSAPRSAQVLQLARTPLRRLPHSAGLVQISNCRSEALWIPRGLGRLEYLGNPHHHHSAVEEISAAAIAPSSRLFFSHPRLKGEPRSVLCSLLIWHTAMQVGWRRTTICLVGLYYHV